jgi:hypothetical protein
MRTRLVLLVGLVALLAACVTTPSPAPPQFATRQMDPVVLTGAAVPGLAGTPVGDIAAFAYVNNAWKQVPVQVDQRKTIELNTAYHQPANTTNPVNVLVYADPNTWVGAGSGVLGANDEIALMAADTGALAPGSNPAGVVAGSGQRVTVTDPLNSGTAYVYLFRRAGTDLKQDAGKRYVAYSFKLSSGDYKTTYKFSDGPNPEDTSITTTSYTRRFHDRWLDDTINIAAAGASKADILDRHKALFAPGNCGRSEDTFDDAEGAFLANINGPVRAIRSYIGANSGPYTQRTHFFYAQREDIVTNLRVHAIPSIMDFYDYSADARGMNYSNDLNPAGVTIDGAPDTLTAGAPVWEKVDGPQGALTHVNRLDASFAVTTTNWYEDNDVNPSTQCTGDADALGASGSRVISAIPNTDPHVGAAQTLTSNRTLFFESPGRSAANAELHAHQVATPLTAVTSPFAP